MSPSVLNFAYLSTGFAPTHLYEQSDPPPNSEMKLRS